MSLLLGGPLAGPRSLQQKRTRRRCRLSLEALEDRAVPAVQIFARGDTLHVEGDRGDNVVHLVRTGNEIRVTADNARTQTFTDIRAVIADLGAGDDRLTALIEPPAPLSPNDPQPSSFRITANLGAGDDMLTANLTEPPDPSLPQRGAVAIAVEGAAGADHIFVTAGDVNGANPLVLDELAIAVDGGDGSDEIGSVIVGGRAGDLSVKVNGGGGNDDITARMGIEPTPFTPEVHASMDIDGGAGDDKLDVEAVLEPVPDDGEPVQSGPVVVAVALNGGGGNDDITARMGIEPTPFTPDLHARMDVDGGAGDDKLDVEAVLEPIPDDGEPAQSGRVVVAVAMNGGGGNDDITARMGIEPTPFAPDVHVTMDIGGGAGDDRVDVQGIYRGDPGAFRGVAQVTARGGSGNDFLTASWPDAPNVRLGAIMDGGADIDGCVATPNFAVINCELNQQRFHGRRRPTRIVGDQERTVIMKTTMLRLLTVGFLLLAAWPAQAGGEVRTLSGHEQSVTAVAFRPDGQALASASWDQTARLWDVGTGKQLQTFKGHTKPVLSVAFSPDGQSLATGSLDFTIKLWNPSTGMQRQTLNGHKKQVAAVAFSPDGKLLASASQDASVHIWDASRGELLKQFSVDGSQLYGLAFSPDGAMLVVAGHKGITAWNVADGSAVSGFGNWKLGHKAVAFSNDGKHVATGGDDRMVLVGALKGDPLTMKGHRSTILTVAFHPDGKLLASGGKDFTIRLWDIDKSAEARALEGHKGSVCAIAFSPDGRLLASASEDKIIKIWTLK